MKSTAEITPQTKRERSRPRITEMEWSSLPNEGIVRKPAVVRFTGVGETTFNMAVKAGIFPEGVYLGTRIRGWPVEQVREMIKKIEAGEVDWQAISNQHPLRGNGGRKRGRPRAEVAA